MRKVVVVGPESTGKSTLCQALAEHYNTAWCPEYARAFLENRGSNTYDFDDLLHIAQEQLKLEDRLLTAANNNLYFIDTDMYVMKVWCEVAFEKCHSFILKQIAQRKYDLYLLCRPDIVWQPDELREYPDPVFREKLFSMYKDIVVNSGVEFAEIYGNGDERVQRAIAAVDDSNAGLTSS